MHTFEERITTNETHVAALQTTTTTHAGQIGDINSVLGVTYPYTDATLEQRISANTASVNALGAPTAPQHVNIDGSINDGQIFAGINPLRHKTVMVTNITDDHPIVLNLYIDSTVNGGWQNGDVIELCMLRDPEDDPGVQYNVKLDVHTSTTESVQPYFVCTALNGDGRQFSDKWQILRPSVPYRIDIHNTYHRFRIWEFPMQAPMVPGGYGAGYFDDPSTTSGLKTCIALVMEDNRL